MVNLTGKFLLLDDPEGGAYTISQFSERLSKYLYFAMPVGPEDGKLIPHGAVVVDIRTLKLTPDSEDMIFPQAQVFASFQDVRSYLESLSMVCEECGEPIEPETPPVQVH